MIPAVSTACLYPMHVEEALDFLLEHGVKHVEIFFNCFSELEDDFVGMLEKRFTEMGAQLRAVHPNMSGYEPFYFFSEYPRRFPEGVRIYERFFRVMERLHCPYFVFHGDLLGSKLPEEEYFERFYTLAQAAKRYGATVLQENVAPFRSSDPGFIRRFKAALGKDALFTLDLKQTIRSGVTLEEMLEAMGDGLRHIHASDSDAGRDCLPPGVGTFDFARFFRRVEQIPGLPRDICVVLELYRENYGEYSEIIKGFDTMSKKI